MRRRAALPACWVAALAASLESASSPLPLRGQETSSPESYAEEFWSSLEWRNVGPARGGRSIAAAGSTRRPFEYYMGTTGGGLWKTTDGGLTWDPVTEGKIGSASIGAVAVCEADPDIVYIGTGETQLRGNIQQGDGAYRSVDAGESWEHIGLAEVQNIARIRVHPDDCDVAWAAAFGKHPVPNPERGIYRTTDGGESWRLVLHRSPRAGGVDISVSATDPEVVYAAIWEAWRRSWGMSSGGAESGLWKSVDGGESWTGITERIGLAEGPVGKVGVAVSPANPERVWAMVEHEPDGGLWRSDDGGETWTRVNDERKLRQRAFYYTRVYADPLDEDVVYVLNVAFHKSTDGGESFETIAVPHGDNHDLWIAADDPDRMINANDGGANVSFNGGESWTDQDYPTAQFYRVATTRHLPYHICGGQQDNSTACIPVRGWRHMTARGPGDRTWYYAVGGCESGHIAPHPERLNIFYAGCYGGTLTRFDMASGRRRTISVWPENPLGQSSEEMVERVQWNFPIVFSPHDPTVLYTASQRVWKTVDEGQSWVAISPDLTRADPATMGPSGGPITKDQTGVETYATVFALAPSPHDPGVIWAGTDDGLVHLTRDGGSEWTNVTPPDAPDFVRINTIEASPATPGKAYVAGIRYLVDDDRAPYIWRTSDYGATWTRIVAGLPEDDFIRAVREDPRRRGLLYAASERTVYLSFDDGARWQRLTLNLPTVQVSDLVVEENDLVIATHGRSFWALEGIGPLRQMNDQVASAQFWLFDPVDPILGVDGTARFQYYLAEDAERLTIEVLDDVDSVVRRFEGMAADSAAEDGEGEGDSDDGDGERGPSAAAGSHSFDWDLRHDPWSDFEGRVMWAARPMGPRALPGRYRVRMTVGDNEPLVEDFELRLDPRAAGATEEDLEERFDLALRIRDRVSEANEALIWVRRVMVEIDDRVAGIGTEGEDGGIGAQAALARQELEAIGAAIYQARNQSNQDPLNFPMKINNRLAALLGVVEGSEARPTEQTYSVFDWLSGLLDGQLDRLEVLVAHDLATLNEILAEAGLESVGSGGDGGDGDAR